MDTRKKEGLLLRFARFFNPFYGKQRAMLAEVPDDVRIQADCMTVVNLFEMPGIVQIAGEHLVIRPCMGRAVSVPLEAIQRIQPARCFNGTVRAVQYQHGFWIEGGPGWRLGFAVTDAEPWVAAFREHGVGNYLQSK